MATKRILVTGETGKEKRIPMTSEESQSENVEEASPSEAGKPKSNVSPWGVAALLAVIIVAVVFTIASSSKYLNRLKSFDEIPGLEARLRQPLMAEASVVELQTYNFEETGQEIEYGLFVPDGYDENATWPLVIALHGGGSTPSAILSYPGLISLAQEHGFILAAPMGYNPRGGYGAYGSGKTRRSSESDPENLGELSEKDVMNVLAMVREKYSVDENRIYLMGHSMGGAGTWYLGIKYSSLWAALAPIAPGPYETPEVLERIVDMPVVVVQGDQDRLLEGTRTWVEKMKELKMDYLYEEVAGRDHYTVDPDSFATIFEFFNEHPRRTD
ncbi:hypothetical protein IIC65_03465 [Candidatus Sumerlaeota bacterium]|nr:hypothetical protein [Candidatus Sumerlaeota bacterium]